MSINHTMSSHRRVGLLVVAAVLGLFASRSALADQKFDLHARRVFTESTATGGFFTVENIASDCLWGLMYIDLSSPAGRGQLALLIQAKSQNLALQRVDFRKNPDGTCSATGIHVE